MRESTIERAVCAYAKTKGCLVMKLSGPNQKGQPDRLFIYRGEMLFVEFKAPGKLPTALQARWIKKLREQKMFASWCDNVNAGRSMIDAVVTIADRDR
jgi:Holliday junction resolvase